MPGYAVDDHYLEFGRSDSFSHQSLAMDAEYQYGIFTGSEIVRIRYLLRTKTRKSLLQLVNEEGRWQ